MHDFTDIQDSVKADLLDAAATRAGVASLWSTFVPRGTSPSGTLRSVHARTFSMPDRAPKIIAYPGSNAADADYVIVGKLGEGGMGIVFEAEQRHLRQRVALKMIRADRVNNPIARNYFFHEAVITAGLDHPGIIPVLEFGISQDGRVFYVMKKASGVPWHRVIGEKSRAENLDIFNRVADVAGYAHSQGVIHRDLKPSNILLGAYGEVWVGDWGVALQRNEQGDYSHALPGGTPQYMPPEMARCDASRIGPRSDVYLLGAILFEIVTGLPPHAGEEALAALENAAGNDLAETDQDDSLLFIAREAMADDPEQRYENGAALQKAVRDCLADDESTVLVRRGDAQLRAALKNGTHESFRQALADYDAALAVSPDNRKAKQRRRKTILEYARYTLDNGEYDLALSIVQPESARNREAADLLEEITDEKKRARRQPRRFKVVNTVLGLVAFLAIMVGAYISFRWGELVYDTVGQYRHSDAYYYNEIHRRMEPLLHEVSAVNHNADGWKNEALQANTHGILVILQECMRRFQPPETVTPSGIRDACGCLWERMDELAAAFGMLRELEEQAPEDRRGRIGSILRSFEELRIFLNKYRETERK